MAERPAGTVTFLFTDVEGSTRLLQEYEREYPGILADQRRLLRAAVLQHGGQEVDVHGGSLFFVFGRAKDALAAAVGAQRALGAHAWPGNAPVRVRMGLHTGEPISTDTGYVGMDVHRAARICAAGYGGQILLSETTHSLIGDDVPPDVTFLDLEEHRLKDLVQSVRLYQVSAQGLAAQFPPLRSLATLPNNLPVQLTSFIGREREMAEVKRLLSGTRLLTLTGPGGCGKTRLALHVAADVLDEYDDGVWLVELAALSDHTLIPQTIASALGIREQPARALLVTIAEYLQPKELLLVLDNCEHLVSGCAPVIEALLRACPGVRLLVTSREPVGVPGETVWTVPPLSMPDPDHLPDAGPLRGYESVRLFVERAEGVARTFALDAHNAAAVAQICRRLDGIPLAIELAAARVKVLSVDEIASRLDDRFRLLTGGIRTALPRHQTLRATMNWSHDLLSPPERILFRRLSVFAGGFTLPAAEAVCAAEPADHDDVGKSQVLDLLTHLVDRSLVMVDLRGEATRYRLLETVRRYALEYLIDAGEGPAIRARHRDWYLERSERAEPEVRGAQQKIWLDLLEAEHDNLRAAFDWSAADPAGGRDALRIAGALWWFWFVRGYLTEGRARLEKALAADDVRSGARAKALIGAGALAGLQGDYRPAIGLAEEGVAIYRELGDDRSIAEALTVLGYIRRQQGEHERAAALCEEALSLARRSQHSWGSALALFLLGEVTLFRGDHRQARILLEESLDLALQQGDTRSVAFAQMSLALVDRQAGTMDRAEQLARSSLAMFLELNDRWGLAGAQRVLALIHHAAGDYDRAAQEYAESLEHYRLLGDRWGVASSLRSLALVAHRRGDLDRAQALCEESLRVFREIGDRRGTADALQTLGLVARRQGDLPRAAEAWQQSLDLFWQAGDRLGTVQCLRLLAEIAAATGELSRAARLFGALEGIGATMDIDPARHGRQEYEQHLRELRTKLPPDEFAGAQRRGRAMTPDEAIAFALQRSG